MSLWLAVPSDCNPLFKLRKAYIMADLNIPVEQAPAVAPPTRTDDQILPLSKAFTASSTIPAIYIQQFWDTMCFNSSTGLYNCQLDDQWFNLHKDILRDALNITPANDNNPFVAPPSSDTIIECVNTLGYPSSLKNVLAMSVNALYQPWRAILSMINMCLTGKTAGFDRPRHPVLQILWGIIHRSNIDYTERIWEEFVQFIQTFLTDKKNLTMAARERGKAEKEGATESSEATKVTKPKAAKATKPVDKKRKLVKETLNEPSPAKRSKGGLVTKKRKPKSPLKLVDEPSDEGVPVEEPAYNEEDANLQRALELSLMEQGAQSQGPARLVVIKEPEVWEKFNPLQSETESDEEASKINARNQEGQAGPNPGIQDEGQAGSNPGDAAESQPQPSHVVHAGPNLEHMDLGTSDASTQQKPEQMDEEFTTTTCPNVQGNLKLLTEDQVILEEPASSTRTLSSLQNLDKDLSFTDQFFMEKPQEEEPWKTNAEVEVHSMVSVLIHQDTSSVPLMTTQVIDLTKSQSDSPLPTSIATTSTITTTTILPPPQPQQSTADLILVKRIGELEQHMADLIQNNLALEERLDKQGSRLYNLENLNIQNLQYSPHWDLPVCWTMEREILHKNGCFERKKKSYQAQQSIQTMTFVLRGQQRKVIWEFKGLITTSSLRFDQGGKAVKKRIKETLGTYQGNKKNFLMGLRFIGTPPSPSSAGAVWLLRVFFSGGEGHLGSSQIAALSLPYIIWKLISLLGLILLMRNDFHSPKEEGEMCGKSNYCEEEQKDQMFNSSLVPNGRKFFAFKGCVHMAAQGIQVFYWGAEIRKEIKSVFYRQNRPTASRWSSKGSRSYSNIFLL
ncbi:retrovirus-related pol polyprotein from transposon TNT 1-94 [Tanacetum coccineum]